MEYIQNLINLAILYALRVLGAILVLVIGFWVVNKLVRSLDKQMKKARIDDDLRPFLKTLISILFKVLIFFSAAGIVGIETTSFIALIAAVGFAVGLALQGSLGNFAAGILVLLFKPYRTGDFIITQGHAGTVTEIQLFSTILFTLDNRKVIIPNGNIAGCELRVAGCGLRVAGCGLRVVLHLIRLTFLVN